MAELFQILLVDDNSDDIELMKIKLNSLDSDVQFTIVQNRLEYEDHLRNDELPDLIICDYHLPEYDGEQALKKLREKHPYLPFILVTGFLSEEEAVELMRIGASDIITKQNIERLGPAVDRELKNFRQKQKSQRELQNAHNRFRKLVEQGGDVVVVLGSDGNPTYLTPSVQEVFGYTVEEANTLNIAEVTHPDDYKHIEKALFKAGESPGKNISVPPVRMKHKDGSWRWFKTSLTDLRHEPSVEGIVDNIRDIHDQVIAARSNKLMIDHTEDSFIYINRDMIIQSFNDRLAKNYKEIFGRDIEAGRSIIEYAQPERKEIVKQIYLKVFEGEAIEVELPFETKDGKTRYFDTKYKPAKNEKGKIIGAFISLLEITEEKEVKLELESKEARFRALVENGRDVVVLFDETLKPFYVSPTIENVLGYSIEEAKKLDLLAIVHPDEKPHVEAVIKKAYENPGETIEGYTSRVRHKNGSWRWIEATVTNLLSDPNINAIVDNFRDVTDRVEAEKNILEAKNKYQTLVQTINGIFWEAEPNSYRVTYMSPQSQEMLGYEADEWLEKEGFWSNHIHPNERDEINRKYRMQTDLGNNHQLEYRFKKSNGEYIWIRDIVSVITKDGSAEVIRGIMTDITQEKELEIKLDQAYKLAKIGNWELNLENNSVYWSKFVKELHEVGENFKPDLENAVKFYENESSREIILGAIENAIENGKSFDVELPIVTAKGNKRWIRTVGRAEHIDGKCTRVFGSKQDIHNQKQAELELEEAYKEKETILESIGDGFFTLDSDFTVSYWNSAAEELLNTPKEKILGKNLWDIFDDSKGSDSYKQYKNVLNQRVAVNFEDYYQEAEKWFDINAYPSEDGISVYFKDITQRKENEEKIKRFNERFTKVTEATNDAIWDFDVINGELFWGKGFETLFGFDLSTTNQDLDFLMSRIHPEDRDRVSQKIEAFMKDGSKKDWFEEYRFKKEDGNYAHVMDRAVFLRNDQGRVVRVVGAMTDLTKQVEEEKQLKLYESVVTNTQESIVITESQPSDIPGRRILYVNKAFTEMTGYEREEVLGRTLSFLNGPNTNAETVEKLKNAIGNYEAVEVEFINYKKNGDEFWVNTSMVPVKDSKGNYIHWVAIGRDVTSRRKYEEEIQTSLAEKETLLAEIHHRVKNNLAVISGMMQLQAFESDNLDLQEKLFDSVSRIKTMATVHEMLYNTNSFSDIDFSQTLEYLIRSVSETLQSNGSTEVNINSEPIKLNINQAIPVSLIVNEVITNAYKHAFKGKSRGKIDINFAEKGELMILTVEDDGVGLPGDFDKYDLSSMGLKLINVLSEQIGSDYDFERLSQGTKFTISFEKSDIRGTGNAYMN